MHSQLGVHHIHGAVAHAAGAGGVVDGVCVIADELLNFSIGLRPGGGRQLLARHGGHGGLGQDFAGQFDATNQSCHVVPVAQKIGVNQRCGQRVFAGQKQTAPAAGAQQAHVA